MYCHCIHNYVKHNDLLCWAYKKNISFLFFHSPTFHSKIYERRGTFFEEEGGNSLKQRCVEGGNVKRKWINMGEGGSKIGNFEQTFVLNAPLSLCLMWFLKFLKWFLTMLKVFIEKVYFRHGLKSFGLQKIHSQLLQNWIK